MANYLYNGVELPELPEWDKTSYPYAYITAVANTPTSGATHILYLSADPFVVDNRTYGTPSTTSTSMSLWHLVDGQWAYDNDYSPIYGGVLYTNGSIFWSNIDIYYDDKVADVGGTLYLAASEPAPKPIAYLYNGVELPALPEWDKETYPYAIIYNRGAMSIYGTEYVLFLTNNKLIKQKAYLTSNDETFSIGRYEVDTATDNEWSIGTFNEGTITLNESTAKPIWTNYDILNEDGSVYLPASDPVPLTTLTARDLYRNVNGQLVKHTLYKKINGKLVALDEHYKEVTNE